MYNEKVLWMKNEKVHWKVNNKSFKRPSGDILKKYVKVKIMLKKEWVKKTQKIIIWEFDPGSG